MSITYSNDGVGCSHLENLPAELLRKILIYTMLPDTSSHHAKYSNSINCHQQPPLNSLPCLITSRTLHSATFPVMYRNITTAGPSTLPKFISQVRCHPHLGSLVRTIDLGSTSMSISFSDERVANPIPELLRMTPLLREIKIQPALHRYLDKQVLVTVFSQLSYLENIDLENCNTPTFGADFAEICNTPNFKISSSITSLNCQGCYDLPPVVFETILPQLPRLTTLLVSRTQMTDQALFSIPSTARLTTLKLNDCPFLPGSSIASFIASHPAAKTLEALHAATDPAINPMLETDVTRILSTVPSTLQSLDLRNSLMAARHIPLLRRLVSQLSELHVGSQLSMHDIESLYLAPEVATQQATVQQADVPSSYDSKDTVVLEPMARAVAVCKLRTRLNTTPLLPIDQQPRLKNLDISSLPIMEQGKVRTSILLGPHARYLQTIDVSGDILGNYEIIKRLARAVGWYLFNTSSCCMIMRDEEGEL